MKTGDIAPERIFGKDEDGYFVITLKEYHSDGTPHEYEKTYYTPFDREENKEKQT